MEVKQFQTETKRLLDLMINSIYTHKEIFLRELISNASDAIDKRHFMSLTDDKVTQVENNIRLELSEDTRTITISDTGIGMTYDEVITNLGTIAKSGSKEFLEKLAEEKKKSDEIDIIGQFGVGFYSAFMVASKVEVRTKSAFSEKGYTFISEGDDSYSIEENTLTETGTTIVLYLREDEEDVLYTDYLDQYKIKDLVKKYSDYVRYPIMMNVVTEDVVYDAEGKATDETTTSIEDQVLNSMIPIWKKAKKDITDEELYEFYKNKYNDYKDPVTAIHVNVEGNLTYNALCFIPQTPPRDLYSDKYEKGLQLYTKGVFILDKCKELIPDYLRFVRGLVDSSDLSLNISREMLQHDRQLQKISSNLEKKILSELSKMLKNDKEKYEQFYDNFGVNLKYGTYEEFGLRKDSLKDLLLFKTTNDDEYTTLKEYVEKMDENQEVIYYASGKSKTSILGLPQMDLIKKQNYNVLVLTDDIDEFLMNVLSEYEGKKFKSINQGDLDLLNDEEKKEFDSLKEEKQDTINLIKEALVSNVSDVVLSKRLTDSPVCLVSGEGVSFEMEKVLKQMPGGNIPTATKILEINPKHSLFTTIEEVFEQDKELGQKYAKVLYNQACLIEGLEIENPVEFTNLISELLTNKK
ncbi:MAG: molecular chaperone HtpG [bacterium]